MALEENENIYTKYLQMMNEIVEQTRKLLKAIACSKRVAVDVYDYDLPVETGVPSYHATKWIANVNMMACFNPTNYQLSYIIACLRQNPVLSVLVSCTDHDYLENRMEIMLTQTTTVVHEDGNYKQQRIFPTHVRESKESRSASAITEALLYPLEL